MSDVFRDGSARFVTAFHFMEHLQDRNTVYSTFRASLRVASEAVIIRGPMFYDEVLSAVGLKFCWADWTIHPYHIEPRELESMLRRLVKLNEIPTDGVEYTYEIRYSNPVTSSNHISLLPLDAPKDRDAYDSELDGPKPTDVSLDNIYSRFEFHVYKTSAGQ